LGLIEFYGCAAGIDHFDDPGAKLAAAHSSGFRVMVV
jgi:hypothetical protein